MAAFDNKRGYVWMRKTNLRWDFEHRIVAEKMLGRELRWGETVHHINLDKTDNRPANLKILPFPIHNIYHNICNYPQRNRNIMNLLFLLIYWWGWQNVK